MRACQHGIHPSVLAAAVLALLQQDAQMQPRHQLVLRQVERPARRTERRKVAGGGVGVVSVEMTAPGIAPRRSNGVTALAVRPPTDACWAGTWGALAAGRSCQPAAGTSHTVAAHRPYLLNQRRLCSRLAGCSSTDCPGWPLRRQQREGRACVRKSSCIARM